MNTHTVMEDYDTIVRRFGLPCFRDGTPVPALRRYLESRGDHRPCNVLPFVREKRESRVCPACLFVAASL